LRETSFSARAWLARHLTDIVAYGAVVTMAFAISIFVLDLRHADASVPLDYARSDAYGAMVNFETIRETGSLDANPRLGAPLGSDFRGDPQSLFLFIALVRFLQLFFHDFGGALNAYFLLSFPATAALAFWALRTLGFSYLAVFVPAELYAFLPYHMLRGEDHLLLATYFLVPPAIVVAFWTAGGRLLVWPTILICVLVGAYHPYYAFFATYLFLLAAAYGSVTSKSRRSLVVGALAVGSTLFSLALSESSYFIKSAQVHVAPLNRVGSEAETYGLKLVQLLLPIDSHRVAALAEFRHQYDVTAPLVNENTTASLGAVGSLGFILLLLVLIFPFDLNARGVLKLSAAFNIGCFLLATIGGYGTLFNYIVTPDIRAYNRIVVFVAFFAFLAVAWALEKGVKRLGPSAGARAMAIAGLALLLFLGVADQSSPAKIPKYAENAAAWRSDQAFVRAIETSLPAGAAVYQLPYVPFPDSEYLMPEGVSPYWLLKGFLHSQRLRWSYGALQGGLDDAWMRSLSTLQTAQLLPRIAVAGFEGIYIERRAYADQRAERQLESELSRALHEEPLTSGNRAQAFYSLESFRRAEVARLTAAGFARARALQPPLLASIVSGCAGTQLGGKHPFRFCAKHAVIEISNLTATPKRASLFGFLSGMGGAAGSISVSSGPLKPQVLVMGRRRPVQLNFTAPPGTTQLTFSADLPAQPSPSGPLYFYFEDFRLTDQTTGDVTDFYYY
jgi:phosphoglycerol transferase